MLKKKLFWIGGSILLVLLLVLIYLGWQIFALWRIYERTTTALATYSNKILEPQNETQPLVEVSAQLTLLEKKLDKFPFAHQFLGEKAEYLHLLNQVLSILVQDQQKIIVLLQNDEELRATGGFMGSYLKLSLQQGNIQEFYIEDIYQPEGQISAFKEAPAGAKEYLSEGEGFKLTDSNWHPDFPSSAQEILTLFSLGGETEVDHLVAINTAVLESIFNEIGSLYLPEFELNVNAQNFTQLARADRDQFFPGSQQKTIFLNAVLDQLKLQINQLSWQQKLDLIQVIENQIQQKNILFYSQNTQLQTIFSDHDWAGELQPLTQNYLYLVESNVGINKANRHIYRQVTYDLDQELLTVDYHNQNPTNQDQLDYINYLRIIIPPQVKVKKITQDGTPTPEWDEIFITNSHQQTYKQVGVLVTVPTQTKKSVTFELDLEPYLTLPKLPLLIQKQPGLPATPYTVRYNQQTHSLIVEQDSTITP